MAAVHGAQAGAFNLSGIARDVSSEQVTGLTQVGDVKPSDWAYQALNNLIERYGCVAGYIRGAYRGQRAITRFEAAALLNACLKCVTDMDDELKTLMAAFEQERVILQGRVDGLEAKVERLEAQQFAATTRLSGQATMVLGGTGFGGSAINGPTNSVNTVSQGALPLTNAVTLNYDVQLNFDTSFSGRDILRMVLRSGNFDGTSNSFGGGGPTSLSQLEVAFQEDSGANSFGIDRLYYQVPFGNGFTATLGGRVGQEDMLAFWPSSYPSNTVLDVLTLNGAPIAYNKNLGSGLGLWWQQNGWSVSASYVAANGADGSPAEGGNGTQESESTASLQLAYQRGQWGIALLYAAVQNDDDIVYGTNFLLQALDANNGLTHAVALSGTWQPQQGGWIPSISAGWGINSTTNSAVAAGVLQTSQSWSVGLNWTDAFAPGNTAGMAFGQAPYVTRLSGGIGANDGNWIWEWWYGFQVSDTVSITPALFYLSRPLGQETPAGQSFNQLGALIKTQFRF